MSSLKKVKENPYDIIRKLQDEMEKTYIIESIKYTKSEDDFINSFKWDIASQPERERAINLFSTKYIYRNVYEYDYEQNPPKQITLEKYLHLKGYTTQGTSYHKLKCDQGISKAFKELFFDNLLKGNVLEFQRLVNELKELNYNKHDI